MRTLTYLVLLLFCLNTLYAQDSTLPKIGEIWGGPVHAEDPWRGPFVKELSRLGWIDGKTVRFVVRFTKDGGDYGLYKSLIDELVSMPVDVLAINDSALPLVRAATQKIPIVVMDMFDPIEEGVTKSLSRPEGNVTGVSWQTIETGVKRLELARELIPRLKRVAFLTKPDDPGAVIEAKGIRNAAARIKVNLREFHVSVPEDFPTVLAQIEKFKPQALLVSALPLTTQNKSVIARWAIANKIPAISETYEYPEAGFLLNYGPNMPSTYKRAAALVDRILRGAKPSALPFEQPVLFDVVLNLKTAKAIKLKIPHSVSVRATRVIE